MAKTTIIDGKEYEVLFDSRDSRSLTPIPEDMLRKLIMLCHPDKHDNSALSTEVTRWLLNQRKK